MKFCRFVCNSDPHISAQFCRLILIFHQMAFILPWVSIVFTVSSSELAYLPRKWKCNFSEMTLFSSLRVSVFDNCKQSITVWLFTVNVLLTLFWSLVKPTNGKIVLQRQMRMQMQWQVSHCLVYTEQLSQCSRLNCRLLNFHPLSGQLESMAFSPSPCSQSICMHEQADSKLDRMKTMGTRGKN